MLPELLLLYSCINSLGCPETTAAYGIYRPEIATIGHEIEQRYPLISATATYVAAISQRKVNIGLTTHLQLQITTTVGLKYTINF
jgi:hypothetical protein